MKQDTSAVSLPVSRAFVVQLAAEAEPEQGDVRGRIEHVVSMKATHFRSIDELVGFMARTLSSLKADDETDEPE